MKATIVISIVTILVAMIAIPLGMIIVLASGSGTRQEHALQPGMQCTASWQTTGESDTQGLNPQQLDAAATIYAAAIETGAGSAGAVVGIATAMQESRLGTHPSSLTPNSDGDVGLFQQRSLVGWYGNGQTQSENVQILLDHAYASRTFFQGNDSLDGYHIPGLLDITGWETMSVTRSAQAVQRSAFPDAYAQHESLARALVMQMEGGAAGEVLCSTAAAGDLNCQPTGLASERDLTPDALRGLRCVAQNWPQVTVIHGTRVDPGSDHHNGRAIDPMIPNYLSSEGIALGDEIAAWFQRNAEALGVTYIIWREQLWSVQRASEGWRRCGQTASCYTGPDHSAAHLDHVHISFHGNAGTGASSDGGRLPTGAVTLPLDPGTYRLTARYNQRGQHWSSGFHTGLDFAAPTGTPLYAVADGVITEAGWGGAYGNLIKLRSHDGTVFYYAHLSRMAVTAGQSVTAGQRIGDVGNTGNSFGAHLHFEVRINGQTTDPEVWLTRQGASP